MTQGQEEEYSEEEVEVGLDSAGGTDIGDSGNWQLWFMNVIMTW